MSAPNYGRRLLTLAELGDERPAYATRIHFNCNGEGRSLLASIPDELVRLHDTASAKLEGHRMLWRCVEVTDRPGQIVWAIVDRWHEARLRELIRDAVLMVVVLNDE